MFYLVSGHNAQLAIKRVAYHLNHSFILGRL